MGILKILSYERTDVHLYFILVIDNTVVVQRQSQEEGRALKETSAHILGRAREEISVRMKITRRR